MDYKITKNSLYASNQPVTKSNLTYNIDYLILIIVIRYSVTLLHFIGFPIWWHEEPAVIRTFLNNYGQQLKSNTLFPFCTSYESPMSEADATLRKGYPDLHWKTGLRLPATPGRIVSQK